MSGENKALPAIPAKRYFTIGEVSELCGVKAYVLRYWEQEFTQLRPMKRRGNRRYYQHHEVLLIRRIRDLLYEQGFTISGARNQLVESGHPHGPAALHDIGEDESGSAGEMELPPGLDAGSLHDDGRFRAGIFSPAADPDPASDSIRNGASMAAGTSTGTDALRTELLAIRALLVG